MMARVSGVTLSWACKARWTVCGENPVKAATFFMVGALLLGSLAMVRSKILTGIENLNRKDPTFHEKIVLTLKIFHLYVCANIIVTLCFLCRLYPVPACRKAETPAVRQGKPIPTIRAELHP